MTGENTAERRILSFWLFYKGYSDKFYALLVSIFAAAWGLFMPDVPAERTLLWWLTDVGVEPNVFLGLVIFFAILWALSVFRFQKPRYGELVRRESQASQSSQEKAAAIESTLRSVMRQLAIHCKANTNSHRVTAYVRHENQFVAVARYSHNPILCNILDEGSRHQEGLGVIGQAWNASESYRVDLPSDRQEWEDRICSVFGYSPERAKSFRMQSLSYAAFRIGNADQSVGVLVMESTSPRGVTRSTLSDISGSLIQAALSEMITEHAKHTPQFEKHNELSQGQQTQIGPSAQRKWKSNKAAQNQSDLVAKS